MLVYYGMVKCIDDKIGEIFDEFCEFEFIEYMMIVFMLDYGDFCGEYGCLNKGVFYEGFVCIFFLLWCLGKVDRGIVIEEVFLCVDFLLMIFGLLEIDDDYIFDGWDVSFFF